MRDSSLTPIFFCFLSPSIAIADVHPNVANGVELIVDMWDTVPIGQRAKTNMRERLEYSGHFMRKSAANEPQQHTKPKSLLQKFSMREILECIRIDLNFLFISSVGSTNDWFLTQKLNEYNNT